MGGNQSKHEEILIAQNGANNASPRITEVETKVNSNFVMLMVLTVAVVLMYLYVAFRLYKNHLRKLFRKDMNAASQSV